MADTMEPVLSAGVSSQATDLLAIAAYCMTPSDDLLSNADRPVWAAARFLDGLAVTAHGSTAPVSQALGNAYPPCSDGVFAWPDQRQRRRPDDAIFLMGVHAFSENFADTGLGSVAHVNSVVVPALLLAMQQRRLSGRDVLAALVVGYNVMEWAGSSLNGGRPRMAHQLRGFRPTATAGPLAAVAVLGRLMNLSVDEFVNALGIACSQGGGLRPTDASPLSAIRIQSGEALRRAVDTITMARCGITARADVLRCAGGWFEAYTVGEEGRYDLPSVGGGFDYLANVSMKLDCNPHTFVTMLDAAREIWGRRGDSLSEATEIVVRVPLQHNIISGGAQPYPTTFSEAVRHVPYCMALAMLTGSYLWPSVVVDGLHREDVRSLTARVSMVVDDSLTALFDEDPQSWPATVHVRWASGDAEEAALVAPETSQWSAQRALDRASQKAEALFDGKAGSSAELYREFLDMESWSDVWARVGDHVLAKALNG